MPSPSKFVPPLLLLATCCAATRVAAQIDQSPAPFETEIAFPNVAIRRPIVLTHAGDGTDRVFAASQYGKVHVFPNKQTVAETEVFLDIESRVVYKDKQNEEGFLGVAFHPRYRENGQFFVYYTTTDAPRTSMISRFRVSSDNPNRADPGSEEEILRVKQPFWNHNGGTLAFGPDGYLYIALGDGGKANDPFGNGQNLKTLLGTILRIDVDHHDPGKRYAVPKDNPFQGRKDARGEIWAYGLRNVWRFSFDRKTGDCWAGDVGQDKWEEIDLIVRGGNYGWNRREAKHPFGPRGVKARDNLIDPIWEYHHTIGKSITGGHVYRGRRLPGLAGAYLYADYVTGKIWALRYDMKKRRVTANQPISGNIFPVMSFGEDEQGEVYFMRPKGAILRFRRKKKDS